MERERSVQRQVETGTASVAAERVAPGPSPAAVAQSRELAALVGDEPVHVQRRVQLGAQKDAAQAAPAPLGSALDAARSSGQALDAHTRGEMESAFGVDFADVRVHADARADRLSQDIQAEAFTAGKDIFFRQGAYDPAGSEGRELLAHELTHVVQQRGTVQRGQGTVAPADSSAEREAEQVSEVVAERVERSETGGQVAPSQATGGAVQRRLWIGAQMANRRLTTPGTLVTPANATAEQMTTLLQQGSAQVAPDAAWPDVEQAINKAVGANPALLGRQDLLVQCRAKFNQWVNQVSSFENVAASQAGTPTSELGTAEDRMYMGYDDLALALIGETDPRMLARLDVERQLAQAVAGRSDFIAELDALLGALATNLSNNDKAIISAASTRYGQFSSIPQAAAILSNPGGAGMTQKVILIDEISEMLRGNRLSLSEEFNKKYQGTPNFERLNSFTLSENQAWVQQARSLGLPIQAGPSGTASRFCAMAAQAGMGGEQIYKICWVLFAFYNGMFAGFTGTHRLHEVMSACERYAPIAQYGYTPDITQL